MNFARCGTRFFPGLNGSEPRRTARRPGAPGYTLIEFVGVLGIMAILAAMLVPVIVDETEIAAVNAETANMNSINAAFTYGMLHTFQIPAATNWAAAVGSWLMLPVANITNNARGFRRIYVYDTSGFGSLALPYAQTSGLAGLPPNPRLMIVSSLTTNLPDISGGLGTNEFNAIWNTAAGNLPATWSGWNGKGGTLLIQRINLLPLFHRLVLDGIDTNIFGSFVIQSGANSTARAYVLATNTVNAWFLPGTVVGLYDTNSSPAAPNLELNNVIQQGDVSFVFENQAWRGQFTGWGTNGPASLNSSVTLPGAAGVIAQACTWTEKNFKNCAPNNNDWYGHGDSPTAMAGSFHTLMMDYNNWCDEGFGTGSGNASSRFNNDVNSINNITYNMCQ